MDALLDNSVAERRFSAQLLGAFAALALVLASIGIYGVVSYSVSQRSHEIGIRMALGAQRRDLLRLVIGNGMKLVAIGLAVGLASALVLTRLMKTLLFNVEATNPVIFTAIALLLAFVAFLGCCFPPRRATKVDPLIALQRE
jgi:putative ABC transport system permease protein